MRAVAFDGAAQPPAELIADQRLALQRPARVGP